MFPGLEIIWGEFGVGILGDVVAVSMTTRGPTSLAAGMRSAVSPFEQWNGASMCVPMCSWKCHRLIFHISIGRELIRSRLKALGTGKGKFGPSA